MTANALLKAVIFDWAGTIVDFGSRAPMGAFIRAFAEFGVTITIADARGPMGMAKRDHILAVGAAPSVAKSWRQQHGRPFGEADADAVLAVFEPMNVASVLDHSAFIPGTEAALADIARRGLRIGSTTGYTRPIMDVLAPVAARAGYSPEIIVCAGDLPAGRPSPLMMWHAMAQMGIWPEHLVVKVDDTLPGIGEGVAAGTWTIGLSLSGNEAGLSEAELVALGVADRDAVRIGAETRLKAAGADLVIESVASLPGALDEIEGRLARGERPRGWALR